MLEYYDRRAPEYDQWYMGTGLFAERDRPGWHEELRDLCAAVAALPAAATLDVACGTGFLTRHLRGAVTGLDQSAQMLEIARERIPGGHLVRGDAVPLPFDDSSFDRVFTGHFYGHLDAANIDLKAFTDDFYHRVCAARLAPVLETLEYLVYETGVWVEITTLLIPGRNDSDAEIDAETRWIAEHLGPDVPLHFTAFHPDYKMRDVPPTPPATLSRARRIGLGNGLRYVYTGNVHDEQGGTTRCPSCRTAVVVRDWYAIRGYRLTDDGRCGSCGDRVAGVYSGPCGSWGARRLPISLARR